MATWLVQILEIVASLLPSIDWAALVPANFSAHIAAIAQALANIIGELIGALNPAPVKAA